MGQQSADLLQTAIQSAATKTTGFLGDCDRAGHPDHHRIRGVYRDAAHPEHHLEGEPRGTTVTRLIRARAASLGLVAALGFLLLVSLVISTLLSALSSYINAYLPFGHLVLQTSAFVMSFALISLLFGAIYKVLPDKNIEWHDVMIGAIVTALLFTIGKSLDQSLHWQQHGGVQLWRGRVADRRAAMDILLGTNIPARRRVHQGLCQSPWQSPRQWPPSALMACRSFAPPAGSGRFRSYEPLTYALLKATPTLDAGSASAHFHWSPLRHAVVV